MRTKLVTVLLVAAQAGCSLGMKTVPSGWDGTTEPECSDSYGAPVGDAVVGAMALGVAAAAIEADDPTQPPSAGTTVVVLGGAVVGIVLGITSWVGSENVKECRQAKTTWRVGGAIGNAADKRLERRRDHAIDAEIAKSNVWCAVNGTRRLCGRDRERCLERVDADRERGWGECVLSSAPAEPATAVSTTAVAAPPAAPPPPRGFFCVASTSTPAANFCTREKAACISARDAAVAAVADLSECALVESAWCVGDRCAPTMEACDAKQAQAGSAAMCEEKN